MDRIMAIARRGRMLWNPSRAVAIAVLASGIAACAIAASAIAAPAIAAPAETSGETAITCTNPASGASWQIRIDYTRGTVDSNPASIGDAEISWHAAADSRNYTLDRKSGDLTVVVASSTGGYFIHDRCAVGKRH
jgi:hypothetical protein